jgi:hypothetical protein
VENLDPEIHRYGGVHAIPGRSTSVAGFALGSGVHLCPGSHEGHRRSEHVLSLGYEVTDKQAKRDVTDLQLPWLTINEARCPRSHDRNQRRKVRRLRHLCLPLPGRRLSYGMERNQGRGNMHRLYEVRARMSGQCHIRGPKVMENDSAAI